MYDAVHLGDVLTEAVQSSGKSELSIKSLSCKSVEADQLLATSTSTKQLCVNWT